LNKNNSKSKEIKDAATIVIVRKQNNKHKILMGQRGKDAVFMPNKFVFPGGAYENNDSLVPFSRPLPDKEKALLSLKSSMPRSESLGATVIRELWEETGLKIVNSYHWNNLRIHGWGDFYKNNIAPDVSKLKFFFRAITPIGRPRRFDARFFICFAEDLHCNLDDFSKASSELNHLQWIEIKNTEKFDLPIITRIVLKEVNFIIKMGNNKKGVPFYSEGSSSSNFTYL
tara:strand:+ start:1300 stop:1983 length:684 start_codon:yes stop_codon:yes gene_type:complete